MKTESKPAAKPVGKVGQKKPSGKSGKQWQGGGRGGNDNWMMQSLLQMLGGGGGSWGKGGGKSKGKGKGKGKQDQRTRNALKKIPAENKVWLGGLPKGLTWKELEQHVEAVASKPGLT